MRTILPQGKVRAAYMECCYHSAGRLFCCPKVHIKSGRGYRGPPAVGIPGAVAARRRAATVRIGPTHAENGPGGMRIPSSAGRAPPVYQGAGGARAPQGAGTLPSKGGRAVHRLMISEALSRRRTPTASRKGRMIHPAFSFFCQPLGGCPCLGLLPRASFNPTDCEKRTFVRLRSPIYWTTTMRAERAKPTGRGRASASGL